MLPGEFYLLRNVRMGRYDGYAQAKLVETKIQKLDPSNTEGNPHFKALLEFVFLLHAFSKFELTHAQEKKSTRVARRNHR